MTTVDKICNMSDAQLIPILAIMGFLFAGQGPQIIKLRDIVPLPKDLKQTRPVTCLDYKNIHTHTCTQPAVSVSQMCTLV